MNIASYLHHSALRAPDRIALSFENMDVSYGELLAMSQRIRSALPRVRRIALLASRTPIAYAGIQAILARGAAYVPLNPSSPSAFSSRMLQLAEVSTIVVGEECDQVAADLIRSHPSPLHVITLESLEATRLAVQERPDASLTEISPSRTVELEEPPEEPLDGGSYVLFTSGSTGIPKGVRVAHSNVQRYVSSFLQSYPVYPEDRHSQIPDITFDLSVHDIFVSWKAGATLVVFPARTLLAPIEYSKSRAITVWCSGPSVPSLLESFGKIDDNALPTVRLSLFCGEKFCWNAFQVWKRVAPNSTNLNYYGPTEATVAVTGFEIPADLPEEACFQRGICIGEPFPGQMVEVRRPDGSICDPMEQGILWLGGDQVTLGYLDQERTAESFVERDGCVWYRTGDVTVRDANGQLFFIGREDFQVKLMGVRVELGEIEGALLEVTGSSFAIAGIATIRGDMEELYCVLPAAMAPRKKEIRDALLARFDSYMVPRFWRFQDDLPRTSNGKIDRKAIKASWNQAKSD